MARTKLLAVAAVVVALVVAGCAGPGTGVDNETDGNEAVDGIEETTAPADGVGNDTVNASDVGQASDLSFVDDVAG